MTEFRVPTDAEASEAAAFLARTKDHSCYVCREGTADCSTIFERGECYGVVDAYRTGTALNPASHWPMYA